jgi:hypothetical protein
MLFDDYRPTKESDAYAGLFVVGQKIYFSKVEALMAATQLKLNVAYVFHDSVYGKVDWHKPLNVPLDDIYRRRAQQLRDKYDYLILHYSAGSDSHNILRTFLDNNIKLDEVFIRWPIEATKKFCSVATHNDDPRNILSEWELTIVPQIEWIKSNYPDQKIVVKDVSDLTILSKFTDDSFLHASGGIYLNPGAFTKQTATSDTEIQLLAKHKSVASIYGANKPQILKRGNSMYTYFADYTARTGGGTAGGKLKNVELFYWTPDMPQIVVEQCHAVYNFYKQHPEFRFLLDEKSALRESMWIKAGDILKSILYTNWDTNKFQVRKAGGWSWINPYDDYIHRYYGNEMFLQRWVSTVKNTVDAIDDRFKIKLADEYVGLRPFTTKMYHIGDFD